MSQLDGTSSSSSHSRGPTRSSAAHLPSPYPAFSMPSPVQPNPATSSSMMATLIADRPAVSPACCRRPFDLLTNVVRPLTASLIYAGVIWRTPLSRTGVYSANTNLIWWGLHSSLPCPLSSIPCILSDLTNVELTRGMSNGGYTIISDNSTCAANTSY